ncbi:UxaA family hydrolase [Clostridium sp. Mt-5]|uniref:UxaA family hydrolase n=1 Tax=Clostridium moutaii TaxID=3240932 RepID=A0ABV4BRY6_9CLOT
MNDNINSLIVDKKDNVAVTMMELKIGDTAVYKIGDELKKVSIINNIPVYHKFSVSNIDKGEEIYKYGQVIGKAIKDIKIGEHVHLHNLISIRENI